MPQGTATDPDRTVRRGARVRRTPPPDAAAQGWRRIPYLGHLLSVSSLVIEGGGTETQAIAGLLHDAVEDQGGAPILTEIGEVRGRRRHHRRPVQRHRRRAQAAVEGAQGGVHCPSRTPPPTTTILVSLADKLDNARALLRDYRIVGAELWQRFSVNDPKQHLWYYRSLLEVFGSERTWLVDELDRVILRSRSRSLERRG